VNVVGKRSTPDAYEQLLAGAKPAKGERAAVFPFLEPDETLVVRQRVDMVGEANGRSLLEGEVVVVVTDRKFIAARSCGGFRPEWEVFTLPYGHLEPGIVADAAHVSIPTSGRRSYYVQLADDESAAGLASSLGGALRAYRRDQMGLDDS